MPNWNESIVEANPRIPAHVKRTPGEDISTLPPEARSRVWAKREDLQETGSFKLRGATNRILRLTSEEKTLGIVAASNGNHGLGGGGGGCPQICGDFRRRLCLRPGCSTEGEADRRVRCAHSAGGSTTSRR